MVTARAQARSAVIRGGGRTSVAEAFVIMHIGNDDLDRVYREVIAPAIEECGLTPRRIDQDNEGGLLNAEIMASIERSDIIIADVTNERQNCYLEVGYALGLGRSANLIITVRRDHLPGEPGYVPDGPRVHFDLAGYDLLLWEPKDRDSFREELVHRIQRRLVILGPERPSQAHGRVASELWFAEQRERALAEIRSGPGNGYMELSFEPDAPGLSWRQAELLEAARAATIDTFGWPIGVVLEPEAYRPRPTGTGIRAVIRASHFDDEPALDLWELRTDGRYYLIQNLFEDQRGYTDELCFDTRIVRVTESLLFCGRLYDRLGVRPDTVVRVTITHGGLADRKLSSANLARRFGPSSRRSAADESSSTVTFRLGEIDARLVDLVIDVLAPVFELFDFFMLSRDVYEEIVNAFVAGRIV
jgi:hypothetical protein